MMSLNRPFLSWAATAAGLCLTATAPAQLRVATWNITNYTGGRIADIQTAVYGQYDGRSFAPDVLLGQEFFTSSAADEFVGALNTAAGSPGDWDAVFVPGDSGAEGNVLFYRTSKVNYQSYWVASPASPTGGPRKAICYKVRLVGYTTNLANLYLYNSHMKAGNTSGDAARRLVEAQNIRDNAETVINASYHFLLGADLNVYNSGEGAYQELVGSQANNNGRFFDPISTPGTWNNNNYYRFVHSQDPYSAMDDRFDQILVNDNLLDGVGFEYIGSADVPYSTTAWNDPNHSYRAWGNDGTSFNQPLRTTGNTMVGPAIAQALRNLATSSGGHVPVYLDLRVPARIGTDVTTIDFGQVPQGASAEALLGIWNDGDVALWSSVGIADLSYYLLASPGFAAPAGTFIAGPGALAEVHVLTMDTTTLGPQSGNVTILATGADETTRVIQLTGEVISAAPCRGDCNCDGVITWRDIDYFVAAISGQTNWEAQFAPGAPSCTYANCDVNADGNVSWRDIDPLVMLMNTACP